MNAKKNWTMPKWAEPYRPLLKYNGWEPEEFMNCDGANCNVFTNGPRAIMCTMAQARVEMLFTLHGKGLLSPVVKPSNA
jgi:hypothetical protein